MGAEKPVINSLSVFDNVPDITGRLHSGMRFKIERYMFLVDK